MARYGFVRFVVALVAVLTAIPAFSLGLACPLTSEPTRDLDRRIIGEWESSQDGSLRIIALDADHYLMIYDCGAIEGIILRGHHSDLFDEPFLSLQFVENDLPGGWLHVVLDLSENGEVLTVRLLNYDFVPEDIETTGELVQFIEQHRWHSELITTESMSFRRNQPYRPEGSGGSDR